MKVCKPALWGNFLVKGTGPLKHAWAFVHSRGLVAGARVCPREGIEEVELKQALDIHRGPWLLL